MSSPYDIALKILLKWSAAATIHAISGRTVARWHNVEMPIQENTRVDLLGETADGSLLHIELQSRNEAGMARRMLEYGAAVLRVHGRFPKQVVLYVGEDPLRMSNEYPANEEFTFRCLVRDMRELDGKSLLESAGIGDNVLAVLARQTDEGETVRQIVDRIAGLNPSASRTALAQLLVLAGLRQLGPLVREEANRMPITENILDHELVAPAYRQGRQEGRQEGELAILRRQIAKRFGTIPAWLEERLVSSSITDLEALSDRVLDAQSLEDLTK